MKQIIYSIIIFTIVFIGCNKDNSVTPNNNNTSTPFDTTWDLLYSKIEIDSIKIPYYERFIGIKFDTSYNQIRCEFDYMVSTSHFLEVWTYSGTRIYNTKFDIPNRWAFQKDSLYYHASSNLDSLKMIITGATGSFAYIKNLFIYLK